MRQVSRGNGAARYNSVALAFAFCTLLCAAAPPSGANAAPVNACPVLATGPASPLYGQRIDVVAGAGGAFSDPAIADLKRMLQGMTGKTFEMASGGESAVRLVLAGASGAPEAARKALAGKGIEAFVICGGRSRLTIVANDPHGLSHGVYFYLERLGARWLLPGERWTITPSRNDITVEIAELVQPTFKVRSFAGTGGFFSWRWGRSYPGSTARETAFTDWTRRLRFGGDYVLGKHVVEAFIADKTIVPILEQNPDYLAKVGGAYSPLYLPDTQGKPSLNIIAKLNAGNPDAVALFCDWIVRRLKEARKNPDKSYHSVFSVEPSDGYGYGDNIAELPGNGSGSDQSFYIANTCARTAAKTFPEVSGIILAYAGHAAPPSFALERNLIVQVTPYAFQQVPPEQFIAQWRKKTNRLALYDYWSIPDWTHDEPSFDFAGLTKKLRYWRANDIEALNAESSYGPGAIGLAQYIAGHAMWSLGLDERALIDEWFTLAFGPARAPMQRMIERWGRSFRLTSQELGLSYADIAEARRLASPDSAEMGRVDDFTAYVHYLQLRLEMKSELDPKVQIERVDKLTEYLLDIDDRLMVHTTRIIDLDARSYPGSQAGFTRSANEEPGSDWAKVRRLDLADFAKLATDGQKAYPRLDWAPAAYTGRPRAIASVAPKAAPDAMGPVMSLVGNADADVLIAEGEKALRLKVTRGVDNLVEIHDSHGRSRATLNVKGGDANAWETFDIPLPPGGYKLVFRPSEGRANGYFSFQAPANAKIALTSFLSPKPTPSPPSLLLRAQGRPQGRRLPAAWRLRRRLQVPGLGCRRQACGASLPGQQAHCRSRRAQGRGWPCLVARARRVAGRTDGVADHAASTCTDTAGRYRAGRCEIVWQARDQRAP